MFSPKVELERVIEAVGSRMVGVYSASAVTAYNTECAACGALYQCHGGSHQEMKLWRFVLYELEQYSSQDLLLIFLFLQCM
jgi:hypothetical protein